MTYSAFGRPARANASISRSSPFQSVAPDYSNGLSVIHQERGTGKYGPRVSYNNIHDNTVVFLGRKGATGIVDDYDNEAFWKENNNIFRGSKYFGIVPNWGFWNLDERTQLWSYVVEQGMEEGGSVSDNRPAMPSLTCD